MLRRRFREGWLLSLVLLAQFGTICEADHYKLLGVSKSAKKTEIKKAYHKLALKHHPDKSAACKKDQNSAQCKKDTRNFMKIGQAYETLSDDEKRRYYDQTGFDNPQQQQQAHRQGPGRGRGPGGPGGPGGGFNFGGGGFPGGGGGRRPPPKPKGPLEIVDLKNWNQFLNDAVSTKRAVVLVIAAEGHAVVEALGKLQKSEELKKAKFAHAIGDKNSPLAKKHKVKRAPAVLVSTRGEPTALREFEGALHQDALERAIAIAVRSNTKKDDKKKDEPPKGKELVTALGSEEALTACRENKGLCIIGFIKDSREQTAGRGRRREVKAPVELQVLQRVAERIAKGQTSKRIKVSFVWVDAQQRAAFARLFASQEPRDACRPDGAEGAEPVCTEQTPGVVALSGKKNKFAGYYHGLRQGSEPDVEAFVVRVIGGDLPLTPLTHPPCLQPPCETPPAA